MAILLFVLLLAIGCLHVLARGRSLSLQNLAIQAGAAVGITAIIALFGEIRLHVSPVELRFWLQLAVFLLVFTVGQRLLRRLAWRNALTDGIFQGLWVFTAVSFWS